MTRVELIDHAVTWALFLLVAGTSTVLLLQGRHLDPDGSLNWHMIPAIAVGYGLGIYLIYDVYLRK